MAVEKVARKVAAAGGGQRQKKWLQQRWLGRANPKEKEKEEKKGRVSRLLERETH